MQVAARKLIRDRVLEYLNRQDSPVKVTTMANDLRKSNELEHVRDSEVLSVVQSMIITGKADYTPGLKIVRRTATN